MASAETEARIRACPRSSSTSTSTAPSRRGDLGAHASLPSPPVETLEEMRTRLELQPERKARCSPTSTRCTTRSGSPSSTRTSPRSPRPSWTTAAAAGVKTLELRYLAHHPHLRRPHAAASPSAPCSPG
jgi:hypothetical protein